jgi:Icc-related predicted phosphoesterase
VLAAIRRNRGLLQEIVEGTTPLLQVHGHIHAPYDESYLRRIDGVAVRVVSLNCDGHAASLPDKHCAVLDLTDAEIDIRRTLRVID